jgi:hypothetical protein
MLRLWRRSSTPLQHLTTGAGHIVHMERAAEVNEAIRAHGPAKRES